MKEQIEKSVYNIHSGAYEPPRLEVIELEVEDAVLTGTPSIPYEGWGA